MVYNRAMTAENVVSAFNLPQLPHDAWTAHLYWENKLGATPTLEQIEVVATPFLADPRTVLKGAELVLGRRVDSNPQKEPDVLPILYTPGFSGEDRFGLLLMQRQIEEAMREKSKS